jgi:hypothetical protein
MNSDPEDFETLRKLMALKRHEQPPPGYLNQLSTRIRTRIERGEGQLNLWDRFSANFSLRPSLAYAFGLTVCGALGLSAVSMVKQEMAQAADSSPAATLKRPAPVAAMAGQFKPEAPPLHVANWLRNTNPTAESQPQLFLFDTPNHAVIPASYESGY